MHPRPDSVFLVTIRVTGAGTAVSSTPSLIQLESVYRGAVLCFHREKSTVYRHGGTVFWTSVTTISAGPFLIGYAGLSPRNPPLSWTTIRSGRKRNASDQVLCFVRFLDQHRYCFLCERQCRLQLLPMITFREDLSDISDNDFHGPIPRCLMSGVVQLDHNCFEGCTVRHHDWCTPSQCKTDGVSTLTVVAIWAAVVVAIVVGLCVLRFASERENAVSSSSFLCVQCCQCSVLL